MKKLSRDQLLKLVVVCSLLLSLLLALVTFSDGGAIPTWKEIGNAFGASEEQISDDYVRFIDVGQGDCILISSNGHNAMIDFGDNSDNGRELLMKLDEYNIDDFDCIFLTHYDSDHIGGADAVLDNLDVDNVIIPKTDGEKSTAYRQIADSLENTDANVVVAQTGKLICIGDFTIEIVGYYRNEDESNDRSIILVAKFGGTKFLFAGDASKRIENTLMKEKKNLDCDVFKASHHGSKYSNSENFLKYITPEYTVISCGANNSYGHPHEEVVSSLERVGSAIYRTDQEGDITFYIQDNELVVTTEK